MTDPGKTTVVVGASPKPERYSNKAIKMLREYGHPVIPVHPLHDAIEGIPVVRSLSAVQVPVDTVTLYVGPKESSKLRDSLVALRPKRVIMNPGAENDTLASELTARGIDVEQACTLVLLRTKQF